MRGFTVAMSILAAIIIGVTSYVFILNRSIDRLEEELAEVVATAEQEAWEECEEKMDTLMYEWEHHQHWLSMFTQHASMDTIRENLFKLKEYVRFQNKQEIMVYSSVLHELLDQISDNEKLNPENLF